MKLSKESEDAFRQCLRILAPRRTPEQKLIQIRTAETYIQEGKWIPAFSVADIALLFYPRDSVRESAMLAQMQQAIEVKELILVAAARGVVLRGDLAAWPDCPQVPTDSPLRYWLPEWMQNTTEVMDTAPEQNTATPAGAGASVGPAPLTTGDIAHCFDGLRWGESEWRKPLGDKPKWLSECVAIPGRQGVSETRWNPVLIGAALVQQGHVNARNVRAKFQTVDLLKPWLDEWKTYEADNLDTL